MKRQGALGHTRDQALSGIDRANEPFDRRLAAIRRVAWTLIAPLLIVGSLLWHSPGDLMSSPVLRGALAYVLILLVLRLAGKRTLSEMTTFDLVILLILSEAIQPAMTGGDESFTAAALLVVTLVAMDTLFGVAKHRFPRLSRWIDDVPTVLLHEGAPQFDALARTRIDLDDIMEAARLQHGLRTLDQVRFAVLERSGSISIVPVGGDPTRGT